MIIERVAGATISFKCLYLLDELGRSDLKES
jgi:hypothetical protein